MAEDMPLDTKPWVLAAWLAHIRLWVVQKSCWETVGELAPMGAVLLRVDDFVFPPARVENWLRMLRSEARSDERATECSDGVSLRKVDVDVVDSDSVRFSWMSVDMDIPDCTGNGDAWRLSILRLRLPLAFAWSLAWGSWAF